MNPEKLDKITSYFLVTGKPPLLCLWDLPEHLNGARDFLLDEVKNSEGKFYIEKKFAGFPKPEQFPVVKAIGENIQKKYVQSFLDFDFFINSFDKNFPRLSDKIEKTGDDQGLLRVEKEFLPKTKIPIIQWLEFDGAALFISRSLPRADNGTLQLSEILLFLLKNTKIRLKIRPDCFRNQLISDACLRGERAHWYGKPFDLKWVKGLKVEEQSEHGPDLSLYPFLDGHCTEFLLSPRKDSTVQFGIEELPHKAENNLDRADTKIFTRFVHGIFDPEKEIFTHLDGAMHIYEKSEYKNRICHQTLKNYNKNYLKAKIFRIDGEIDYEIFRHVIGAFYKWNLMPIEYFGNMNVH